MTQQLQAQQQAQAQAQQMQAPHGMAAAAAAYGQVAPGGMPQMMMAPQMQPMMQPQQQAPYGVVPGYGLPQQQQYQYPQQGYR